MMFARIESLVCQMGKCVNSLTTSVNRGSNIQCLFPTVGQCTTQSVSAIILWGHFSTVPFSLPPVPDCTVYLTSVHRGIFLIYIYIVIVIVIVENIMKPIINHFKCHSFCAYCVFFVFAFNLFNMFQCSVKKQQFC